MQTNQDRLGLDPLDALVEDSVQKVQRRQEKAFLQVSLDNYDSCLTHSKENLILERLVGGNQARTTNCLFRRSHNKHVGEVAFDVHAQGRLYSDHLEQEER